MIHQSHQHLGSIEHYYGDIIRQFFVGIAILVGISIPFSGNVQLAALFAVPAVVVLIVLAGLTNPHGNVVLVADAVASIAGFVLTEIIAVAAYNAGALIALAILEFVAVLFLATSYYSIKTVRALAMNKIGQTDRSSEFSETESR